ncbi:peptidoglycan-binding protein LysM [Paracoccus sp. R12_1]|jgi:nucleoid-associated protein YgaU|uniref:peptidoglycan-binding protein LysM n=1 Tax=unclassified Paracoccus (in: a-proteobacteria) TaxID=2688777 RepID=UPI000C090888|nr:MULTISPECIES: peptidoglycan-binding protein LysM [unclassified Paracoccus (in: a-proteobacteria)]MBO9453751.1 peptidoglycan-binding protein LysM [Paracoccus sp. R12_2]MBO9486825.1 peptidoglycan-binding protein LysM [Paracoccus sp. R12_1]PHQ70857.1 MAG: peptidoglycan-binding protein LysM [Paracoccus sp. (in: a-proteobacteria)]
MAIWDFVKDAGKSIFGKAEAATPSTPAQEKPAGEPAKADDTKRKVAALKAELRALDLDSDDVHLTLKGDTVKVESRGADRATMEKLILAVGNIEGIAKVEADLPQEQAAPVFHTVKKGETLSGIAKQHLGSANKYHAIFEANRPMLSDPDKIYPGQVLRIPQDA